MCVGRGVVLDNDGYVGNTTRRRIGTGGFKMMCVLGEIGIKELWHVYLQRERCDDVPLLLVVVVVYVSLGVVNR